MKAISEYTIGNTAVRIVDNGRKIRVINVEQQKKRKSFRMTALAIFAAAVLSLSSCLWMVSYQSTSTMLDRQVFRLKNEVEMMERENKVLEKKLEDESISYDRIYKKALEMGMDFPKNKHVMYYTYKKGTAIKLFQSHPGED